MDGIDDLIMPLRVAIDGDVMAAGSKGETLKVYKNGYEVMQATRDGEGAVQLTYDE